MKRRLKIDLKDDLIEASFVGDSKTAEEQIKLSEEFLNGVLKITKKSPDKKFKLLFNVGNRKSVSSELDKKALDNYNSVLSIKNLSKMAVVGDSKIAHIIVAIIFFRLKERRINWFSDRKRALKWLGVN